MARLFGLFWRLVRLAIRLGLVALLGALVWVWFANPYEDTPHAACTGARPPIGIEELEQIAPGYVRPESSTYLRLPERYIVYNSEEYARAIASGPPSRFPYFRSAAQYWRHYYRVFKITQGKYGFNAADHPMLMVVGVSFTVEGALKGAYENTIGRLSEWGAGAISDEDKYAAKVAEEYARSLHSRPFYDFPYGRALTELWRDVPLRGANQVRKVERRVILSVEYGIKGVYRWVIRVAKKAISGAGEDRVHALVTDGGVKVASHDPRVREVARPSAGSRLIAIPSGEVFTDVVPALAARGVVFHEIAGNDEIFLTALAPANWKAPTEWRVVLSEPILTEPGRIRIGFTVPVSCVRRAIDDLRSRGATLEHLYDY
jgi:hypothetical protein